MTNFGQQAITFILGVVLARFFLSPSDYGLIGMLTIFVVLSGVLMDSGFTSALIRKQGVHQADLSTVFYFNLVLSAILYTTLYYMAPVISKFYNQPLLVPLCRTIALILFINASSNIQYIQLLKELKLKEIAMANFSALIVSILISLLLAFKGYGVWVLVWQNLSYVASRNLILWFINSWRPTVVFRFDTIRELWKFSSSVILTSIISAIFNNIFSLLIGKFYPLKEVGYYTQANKFSELSSGTITATLQTVSLPVLSKLQNDPERFQRALRKIIRVVAFLSFPVLFGLSAIAKPLVYVLLTEKWANIIDYMILLCIGGAFLPIIAVNINAIYARGLSAEVLKLETIRRIILLVCIGFTVRINTNAFVTSLMLANIIGYLTSLVFIRKNIGYTIPEQLKDILPYFGIAGVMSIAMYVLSYTNLGNIALLAVQIVVGTIIYLGTVYLLGSKVFSEIIGIIRGQNIT